MNIFVTSKCPIESAKYLDSLRCNKMILESAQMLSTALRVHGCSEEKLYKISHKNHPCSIWSRATRANYLWLYEHFVALATEYHKRRGKWHMSYLKLSEVLKNNAHYVPQGKLTKFANCAARQDLGISYKHMDDVTKAYQLYLNDRWENDVREPVWT